MHDNAYTHHAYSHEGVCSRDHAYAHAGNYQQRNKEKRSATINWLGGAKPKAIKIIAMDSPESSPHQESDNSRMPKRPRVSYDTISKVISVSSKTFPVANQARPTTALFSSKVSGIIECHYTELKHGTEEPLQSRSEIEEKKYYSATNMPKLVPFLVKDDVMMQKMMQNICKCETQQRPWKSYPDLILVLPDEYDYKVCEWESISDGKFRTTLRMTINSKKSLEVWTQELETKTKATFKIIHKRLGKGKKTIFTNNLYCHRKGSAQARKRPGKITGCLASMTVILKPYHPETVSYRSYDPHLNDYPAVIKLNWSHNHTINSEAALRHQPVSSSTKDQLTTMFKDGPTQIMSPLEQQLKEYTAEDKAFVPDTNYVQSDADDTFHDSPRSVHFPYGGLDRTVFDRYGHPSLYHIMKHAQHNRVYRLMDLSTLLAKTDSTVFVAAAGFDMSRDMYNPHFDKSTFLCKVSLADIGNGSITLLNELFLPGTKTPCVRHIKKIVIVNTITRKPTQLPEYLKKELQDKCALKGMNFRVDKFVRPNNTFFRYYEVVWSDTDYNDHTNYASYAKMAVETLHNGLHLRSKRSLEQKKLTSHPPTINGNAATGNKMLLTSSNCMWGGDLDALSGVSKLDVSRGARNVEVCYLQECVEGDVVVIHVWQAEDGAVRCSIEDEAGRSLCQITLRYFEPLAKL